MDTILVLNRIRHAACRALTALLPTGVATASAVLLALLTRGLSAVPTVVRGRTAIPSCVIRA